MCKFKVTPPTVVDAARYVVDLSSSFVTCPVLLKSTVSVVKTSNASLTTRLRNLIEIMIPKSLFSDGFLLQNQYACSCLEQKLVCGSDSKTYDTICSLNEESMRRGKPDKDNPDLHMVYWGPCTEGWLPKDNICKL